MNIALLGYGKMGKAIEKIAIERGHSICYKTSSTLDHSKLKLADVAIDFSIPEAAFTNITTALQLNVPVISGTTGWLNDYQAAVTKANNSNSSFLYASNFSVGVNLFFKLNTYFSKLMARTDYKAKLEETHHIHKKDAPSGTAISLAEELIKQTDYQDWDCPPKSNPQHLPIEAYRKDEVFGDHSVTFYNEIDQLSISHSAHSRDGFSKGAIIAAEWIINQPAGVYTMAEVLDDLIH